MNSALTDRAKTAEPWYRVPFVWLLIGIPASSVVVGFTMLSLAISSFDGLVVDDYYKYGMTINEVLDRERQAQDYGLSANVEIDDAGGILHVDLRSVADVVLPDTLRMRFLHATREGFDRDMQLRRTPSGGYAAELPDLVPGRWYVDIETASWRLPGVYFRPGASSFQMNAHVAQEGS